VITVEDEKAKDGERTIPILKHFPLFHASQIEGMPTYVPPTSEEAPWTKPSVILENSGVKNRMRLCRRRPPALTNPQYFIIEYALTGGKGPPPSRNMLNAEAEDFPKFEAMARMGWIEFV
jgi:hypothetical protein